MVHSSIHTCGIHDLYDDVQLRCMDIIIIINDIRGLVVITQQTANQTMNLEIS